MPRRKDENDLEKVTLNLIRGEFGQLGSLYPQLGSSKALRMILHAHLQKIAHRARTNVSVPVPDDIPLENLIE